MSATQLHPLTSEQLEAFEKFAKVCSANGIHDLTEEEYRTHIISKPGIGTAPAVRTIRHYRKIAGEQYVGYALGSRDRASRDFPLEETNMGDLLVWDDQEGFQKFVVWDGFHGRMGNQHSLVLDHKGKTPSVKGRGIVEHAQRFRPDRFAGWTPLAELKDFVKPEGDDYPIVTARGKCVGVYRLKDFDLPKEGGKWQEAPITQNQTKKNLPAFVLVLGDQGISISVEFGPYKNGEYATNMDYIDTAACPNLEALEPFFDEADIAIVGELREFDIKSDDQGRDLTKLYLRGFCFYDLGGLGEGEEVAPTAPIPEPKTPVPESKTILDSMTGEPLAETPVDEKYPDASANLGQLMGAVKIAVDQIGPTATPEKVRQALKKEPEAIPADLLEAYSDSIILTAIDRVLGRIPMVAAKAPAEPAGPVDSKMVSRFMKLIKKNDTDGTGVSLDFLDSEAEDLWDMSIKQTTDLMEHLLNEGLIYEMTLGKVRVL